MSGCSIPNSKFVYNIFMIDHITNRSIKLENESYYFTTDRFKLNFTIRKELFQDFSTFKYWKIELIGFSSVTNFTGSSSLLFFVNQPPKPGACNINPSNGTTSTLFNIFCFDWTDENSSFINYTFYGKKNFFKDFEDFS